MAVVAPELQREQLRAELHTQELKFWKDKIAADEKQTRELNNLEQAALTVRINSLLAGRDLWLQQMREAKMQQERRALNAVEEELLNRQVRALLIAEKADRENEEALKKFRAKQQFIANFKYVSDEIPAPAPAPATGFEGMLNGMLSKLTGTLGDGPFAFIGKLLTQIFSFIFPLISAFKEMGKKTTAELIKEGSFDEADAELTMQEEEFMSKLSDIKEMGEVLDAYKAELEKLKTVDVDGQKVHFADTTEAYKRKILAMRSELLKKASSLAAPGFATHAERVVAEQRRDLKEKQLQAKQTERAPLDSKNGGEEVAKILNLDARIQAINAEFEDLKRVAEKAKAQEDLFVGRKAAFKAEVENSLLVAEPILDAEKTKQRAIKKGADDQKTAKDLEAKTKAEREEKQHNEQLRLAQAEEARKTEAHKVNMAKLVAETAKAEAKARAAQAIAALPSGSVPAAAAGNK